MRILYYGLLRVALFFVLWWVGLQLGLGMVMATLAAAMQDKMWEFHDALFVNGTTRSGPELERDGLIAIAGELGLDTEKFATDFDSEAVIAQIRANAEAGRSIGVASTPAFLLGGQPIVGAQPTEVFRAALAQALERAGQ